MPKTKKGRRIYNAMLTEYPSAKVAKRVFYASANKGTIRGVHRKKKSRKGRR